MPDPSTGEAVYRQVARMIEARIHAAEPGYGPGWVLPQARKLARELGLGDNTVRDAYRLLEHMGLVVIRQGYGAKVREPRQREVVTVPAGTVVTARMPTFAEQDEWDLDPGVPMLCVGDQAWPADRYELVVGDSEPPPAPEG